MYRDPWGGEHRYGPPPGWAPREGQESLGPAQWEALVARGLSFTSPYEGAASLRWARGTCLEPLIVAGDVLAVRPVARDEALVDGGLYVIDWENAAEVAAYREEIGAPSTEKILIAKFLRYVGFEWWCQCRDSLARLDGEVVEMVVGVSRPESVECRGAQIGANAATEISSVSLGSYVGTAIAQLIASVTVGAKPQAYTATVTVSADVWKTNANPAQCWLNESIGPTVSQPFNIFSTVSPGTRIAIVASWAIPANTAATFGLFYNSATVGNFGSAANIDLRVDVVKK